MTDENIETAEEQAYNEALDNIWEGDQLERQPEAQQFINFIEGITNRPKVREDVSSFTISVDAGYGEGKTYFLDRVAKQMKLKRPVAFVDAWRDDLADEPLTALIVTLQDALSDLIENNPEIKSKFETFKSKAGAVTKIAGKGLLKKGLSLLITDKAVDGIEAVIGEVSDDQEKDIEKTVSKISGDAIDAVGIKEPAELMQNRIDDFVAGREAIDDFKKSLRGLIAILREDDPEASIVIIIDELDRCRPTYAVKLLEEVKHLFDVEGLVFVFGINGEQLGHSLAGAYGSSFNGQAYLSRFINRQYRLKTPSTVNFVRYLLEVSNIPSEYLIFPPISGKNPMIYRTVSDKISFYLRRYAISIRDSIKVIESLQICKAMVGGNGLFMPLLLPLLLSRIVSEVGDKALELNNDESGGLTSNIVKPVNRDEQLSYKIQDIEDFRKDIDWFSFAEQLAERLKLPIAEQRRKLNEGDILIYEISEFISYHIQPGNELSNPSNYAELIETVDRYTNPAN